MARYATEQSFGGQRASVGRVVIISQARHDGKLGTCLRAGVVAAVSDSADLPWTLVVGESEPTKERPFYEAKTPSDAEAMPLDHWTWPPRV